MGAQDAINALRSNATAESTLTNVISDQLGTVNGDSQRAAGTFNAAKSGAEALFSSQQSKLDTTRRQLGASVKEMTESGIDFTFSLINACMGGGGSALNIAADIATMLITMKIMAEDILQRDRTWDATIKSSNFVKLYSPGLKAGLTRA